MLDTFLREKAQDHPVYLPDVREDFQKTGTRPFHLLVTTYDGDQRLFPLMLPIANTDDEKDFVAAYVHASIYNILSTLGAVSMDVYIDRNDEDSVDLARSLDDVFQTAAAKADRSGYGKCLNVNERVLGAISGGGARFAIRIHDIGEEPKDVQTEKDAAPAEPVAFDDLEQRTADRLILGMDIGGTDIKLAVSWNGRLCACKEFDWFPALSSRAEQLIEPMMLLTRLMRAVGSLMAADMADKVEYKALARTAGIDEMREAAGRMEEAAGSQLRDFDAIGLCFPDVVIRNKIVGGEATKTKGMRENTELDYEEQFGKITEIAASLSEYVVPGGAVGCINDGPMAAFTAMVEQAAGGRDVSKGVLAHTLGTELGTGWVKADGSIPDMPMEVYNCVIDLGSGPQQAFDADDVRSVRNFNTDIPGTLQKYASQAGVFRLAAKLLPASAPEVLDEATSKGLLAWDGDRLIVPTEPEDMRKACLEFFMDKAADPSQEACQDIFREIGEYMAATWDETQHLLEAEAQDRMLFGRLVKNPACFDLMCEGAARRNPDMQQYPADASLANTSLMRQLEADPDYTVAQFAQAIGAIHYAAMMLPPAGGQS